MRMKKILIASLLLGVVFISVIGVILISGRISPEPGSKLTRAPDLVTAQIHCVLACQSALEANQNLSAGPCLLDPIAEIPTWVCDVAHSPRIAIDNLPENQCQAYRNGTASHFVEVTPNCTFIQAR